MWQDTRASRIYVRFIDLCEHRLIATVLRRSIDRDRAVLSLLELFRTGFSAKHKEDRILDILQLRIRLDAFDQLRVCQAKPRNDCHAAFTVTGMQATWPVASWQQVPRAERINVRGWLPLLDQIADELLIWRPQGGCFFVFRDRVIYRVAESDAHGVLFLQLELNRPVAVPLRRLESQRVYARP